MDNLCFQNKFWFSAILAVIASACIADDFYTLQLDISPVDDITLEIMKGDPAIIPESGNLLVLGTMDHIGFYIENLDNITVEASSNKQIPLIIDSSGIISEFGGIVSMMLAFEIPQYEASELDDYRILWGESINAENKVVGAISIDASQSELYRQFQWKEALSGDAEGDAPFSTITVIADSTAEYHFLWYLVPMVLIFALLTIRKTCARDS